MKTVFVYICAMLLCCAARAAEPVSLSADRAHRQARDGRILLLDIRTPGEWRKTGVPDGAVALTMHLPGGAFRVLRQSPAGRAAG